MSRCVQVLVSYIIDNTFVLLSPERYHEEQEHQIISIQPLDCSFYNITEIRSDAPAEFELP